MNTFQNQTTSHHLVAQMPDDPDDLELCLMDFMLPATDYNTLYKMATELKELEEDNANHSEYESSPSSDPTHEQILGAYEFFQDNYRDAQIGPSDYTTIFYPRKDQEFVKLTVGSQGCNLKRITQATGLRYLWYNKEGFFQLWGETHQMIRAKILLDRQANWSHQILENR
jgi:hypothetical protein